ncbi:TrbC/VirB2 family protein [Xanthomonas euvesicatoria]|uniref:TrbC/VirB2 family protein n=1 Tax=Xanthomonas euvesicatoria TaxID=456327 RepID=UPI001C462AC0|nr:TrbC/VirB2 family protein [Xanthomonas euvesicatoria]MBV6847548.1 TrbC/VirB2 family protein [Xanthomonas campestris pv. paulliniae]MDH4908525.1 TrbC/VirB2 family protein [Xanthomonas euvesicatoria]
MKMLNDKQLVADAKMIGMQALKAAIFTSALLVAGGAGAQVGDLAKTDEKVCGFLDNINSLLTMGSVAVVTIAVIVAGYQIAFAHKRISEVSPILIGGVLIGAAGQIANMVIGKRDSQCQGEAAMALFQALHHYA